MNQGLPASAWLYEPHPSHPYCPVHARGSRLVHELWSHILAADAASNRSTISLASASAEVAAGDGAFLTCVAPGVWEITKSSTSRPSRPTAWARTPLSARPSITADSRAGTY